MAKEGFYSVQFAGRSDFGLALIALDTGLVIGCDSGNVKYDGTYRHNVATNTLDVDIKATVPAGTALVTGIPASRTETSFSIKASLPADLGIGKKTPVFLTTSNGPVNAIFEKIRDFPN